MKLINTKHNLVKVELDKLSRQTFTGSLSVRQYKGVSWNFFLRLGRLVWVNSEASNFQNQWKRHIESNITTFTIREKHNLLTANQSLLYQILTDLFHKKQQHEKKSIITLISNILTESFLDIFQYQYQNKNKLQLEINPNIKFSRIITLIKINDIYQKAIKDWKIWHLTGLSNHSPNEFPIINNHGIIKNKLNSKIIDSINGTDDLRYIAFKNNLNLLTLTKILDPFIKINAISLKKEPVSIISSFSKFYNKSSLSYIEPISLSSNLLSKNNPSRLPVICCIDDSIVITQKMEEIISKKSYNLISINEPSKAISVILKKHPDLIFLDLIMPDINGYELCYNIRKFSEFETIPIVILTSKNALIDRVKAKVVGATTFITKPPEKKEILAILDKYLSSNILKSQQVEKAAYHF